MSAPASRPTEQTISDYIVQTFPGTDLAFNGPDRFFIYDPDRAFEGAQRMPFATLVTRDEYEAVSNLNRPGVFRLNLGVKKSTFIELLGAECHRPGADGLIPYTGCYTALDTFMPHPFYGHMHWLSVLNPSTATFDRLKIPLAEAYAIAKQRAKKFKA